VSGIENELALLVRRIVREELAAATPTPKPTGMVSVKAFAKLHDVAESTVRERLDELAAVRVGRVWRIPANAELGKRVAIASSGDATSERIERRLGLVPRGGR
jgi:hypothetical protein